MASRKKPTGRRSAKPPSPAPKDASPPAPPPEPSPKPAESSATRYPIVGIGASAGGLEAFKLLFSKMPANPGMAFVLIPHLDPTHESLMVQLLGRYTNMPVVEAEEGMQVEADHVYVIPPNKYLALSDGALHLTGPVERSGLQTSIDLFLRSLAEDQQERAICIILSGTGAHGSLGLKAVKAEGGMAVVQDPSTAAYDQMPRNAIATGLADFVVGPDEMPSVLTRYVQHFYVNGGELALAEQSDHLNKILALLGDQTKFDFRCYRKRMLWRRIERRMSLCHLDQMADYLEFLRTDPDEVKHLTKDLLISVTCFFRDSEAFDALAAEAIARIIERRPADSILRVWVAGCATGEEAYSVAMLFLERCAAAQKNCHLQVFASDIDAESVQLARHGTYPDSIAADVSPQRLERFFTRVDEHTYQVNRLLRESVVFAVQNLITDVPFSKLDLITCRNLLIYLEPEQQKKIIAMLHFALVEDGYLFLGPAETVGRQSDMFEAVSKKWRVYRRIGPSRPDRVDFPIGVGAHMRGDVARFPDAVPHRSNYAALTHKVLLDTYCPAAVLISRQYAILYFQGDTASYLDLPSGEPQNDLLHMAREGLSTKLRAGIHKAVREAKETTVSSVQMRRNGDTVLVNITIQPVQDSKRGEQLLLVTFEDVRGPAPRRRKEAEVAASAVERELEAELRSAREELQHSVEELETYNEELKSSNEEVMSMNEELQSANEELETSKEELQSLNEELNTVNNQLQEKVSELEASNNDLANLLTCTDIATIFLDTTFRIKRYTPPTVRLLNLIPGDLGRPLSDITLKYTDGQLKSDMERVLRSLTPLEREVPCGEDQWCLRRILPYRTLDNKIEGIVVTFIDVTQVKHAAEQQRRLAAVLMDSNDAVSVYDFSGQIIAWNRSAEQLFGWTERDALHLNVQRLIPPEQRAEAAAVLARLRKGEKVPPFETHRLSMDNRLLDVRVTLTALRNDADVPLAVASTVQDISDRRRAEQLARDLQNSLEERVAQRTAELETANRNLQTVIAERQKAEEALRDSSRRLTAILDTAAEGIISIDEQGTVTAFNKAAEEMFGYPAAAVIGQNVKRLMAPPFADEHDQYLANFRKTGERKMIGARREVVGKRADGSFFPLELSVSEVKEDGPRLFTGIVRDTSDRRLLERQVQETASREQQRIGQDLHDSIGQELTGLGLMADGLWERLPDKSSSTANTVQKMAAAIRRALKQVRNLTRGLIPVEVDAEGLMAALGDLAERTQGLSSLQCRFTCTEPVPVENNITATHLYHIAQEAVTNALKHAKAKNIEIELRTDGKRITLTVRDDGDGTPDLSRESEGMGLKIMRYRAGLINAALTLRSVEGGGTLVSCTLMGGDPHADEAEESRREGRPDPDRR